MSASGARCWQVYGRGRAENGGKGGGALLFLCERSFSDKILFFSFTAVYVSAGLDRLLDVDDRQYRFELVMFIMLTWTDPRAEAAIQNSTANYTATGNCINFCTSARRPGSEPQLCCGGDLWLPHLEFMNVIGFPEERVLRYGIRADGPAVAWWTHVEGTFYTSMSFKAFPFDTQRLIMQVSYGGALEESPVQFLPSTTSIRTFQPKAGDDISGWTVQNVSVLPFYVNPDSVFNFTTPSAPTDPWPLHPANRGDRQFFSPLWRQGFMIVVTVDRISSFYIYVSIIPLLLSTVLAFLNFFLPPTAIAERLGTLVTLFLALVALALVIAETLPHSSEIVPTQQLTLISYVVLAICGIEAILVYRIANMRKEITKKEAVATARRQFDARWRATMAARRGAAAPAQKGCLRWRGRRRAQDNREKAEDGEENGGGAIEVAMPMGDPPTMTETASMPSNAARVNSGPQSGALSSSSSDSDDADHQGTGARAAGAASPSFTAHKSRFGAAVAEARRNPDYAVHMALLMDRACFWTLLLLYTIAVILILAINATYQAPLVV